MNHSFLLFLIPTIIFKMPLQKSISLLILTYTTFLYHNNEMSENIDFLRFIDQLAIINASCSLSFSSPFISIFFMSLYLLERIYTNTQIIPCFVFFITSLRYIHNKFCLFFFICSTYMYLYLAFYQISNFNYYDRYLWHFINVSYITIGLSIYYQMRFNATLGIYFTNNKFIQNVFENIKTLKNNLLQNGVKKQQ